MTTGRINQIGLFRSNMWSLSLFNWHLCTQASTSQVKASHITINLCYLIGSDCLCLLETQGHSRSCVCVCVVMCVCHVSVRLTITHLHLPTRTHPQIILNDSVIWSINWQVCMCVQSHCATHMHITCLMVNWTDWYSPSLCTLSKLDHLSLSISIALVDAWDECRSSLSCAIILIGRDHNRSIALWHHSKPICLHYCAHWRHLALQSGTTMVTSYDFGALDSHWSQVPFLLLLIAS